MLHWHDRQMVAEGQARAAARLLGRQQQLLEGWRQQPTAPTVESMDQVHREALALISEADWQAEVALGRRMDAAEALRLVMAPPPNRAAPSVH